MKKLILFLLLFACSQAQANQTVLLNSQQLLVVTTSSWDAVMGHMQKLERHSKNGAWFPVGKPIPVVVGKNGMHIIAGLDKQNTHPIKLEGDGTTPAGIFPIGKKFAFTETKNPDYILLQPTTICVDDPKSNSYNQIINTDTISQKDWNSFEQMRSIPQYKIGAVIDFNNPVKAGKGSCVFLHIWKTPTIGTAGCVAMDETKLKETLQWLDSKKNPKIAIYPEAVYNRLKSKLGLP